MRLYRLLPALLLALGCSGADRAGSGSPQTASVRSPSPIDALVADGEVAGFRVATEPRDFVFPQDHGPHPDFQTEWWYVTGNLETKEGRRFGIQWTIFRRALRAEMPERASNWASRQLFMGHVALADIEGQRHLAAERFTRGAAGLAGAESEPFQVWLEDWRIVSSSSEGIWPMQLQAKAQTSRGEFSIDLELQSQKPLVLQGDRGLSWKHEGAASFYYSFTRIDAAGHIELDGERFELSGETWLDREWSTSTLGEEQAGWDWFALQLADGRDLMFYQLRAKDGSAHAMSAGVLVDPEGNKTTLALADVELEVLERWRSPRGGDYPIRWRLQSPRHGLDLEIVPFFADQELDIAFRYWEGAVDVRGSEGEEIGRGYVELVGYAEG